VLESVDWICLAHYRGVWSALVDMVINLLELLKVGNFLNRLATISFSRRILLRGVTLVDYES
jgi:hypothetical protein